MRKLNGATINIYDEYWTDIEYLPLIAWVEACKGNLKLCRKTNSKKLNDKTDGEAWEMCFNSYISRIGLSANYEDYLNNVKERAELQIEYLLSNKGNDGQMQKRDRNYLNEINRLTHLINEFIQEQSKKEHDSVMKNLNWLSKSQRYHIKINEITALQYFELIKEITKKSFENGEV